MPSNPEGASRFLFVCFVDLGCVVLVCPCSGSNFSPSEPCQVWLWQETVWVETCMWTSLAFLWLCLQELRITEVIE